MMRQHHVVSSTINAAEVNLMQSVYAVVGRYGKHTYQDSHYTWLDGYKLVEPYRITTFRVTSVSHATGLLLHFLWVLVPLA
jgi:hypothetical protein